MLVLGLDVSTAATGWCILNDFKKINWGVIKPDDSLDESAKAFYVSQTVAALIKTYRPDDVAVEDTFLPPINGKQNVSCLKTLNRIAGQIQHVVYDLTGKEAIFYMATATRKTFPDVQSVDRDMIKDEIKRAVNAEYFGRVKLEGNKITDDNIADAFVIAHHHCVVSRSKKLEEPKTGEIVIEHVVSETVVTKKSRKKKGKKNVVNDTGNDTLRQVDALDSSDFMPKVD